MNVLRLVLVLVLATLLPLRGVMAAASVCPMAIGQAPAAVAAVGDSSAPLQVGDVRYAEHLGHHVGAMHDAHAAQEESADAASASSATCDEQGAAPAHDHQAGTDRCTVCAAYCSSTPLAASWPAVAVPAASPAAAFPAWSAPAPAFLADGTERPPRAC